MSSASWCRTTRSASSVRRRRNCLARTSRDAEAAQDRHGAPPDACTDSINQSGIGRRPLLARRRRCGVEWRSLPHPVVDHAGMPADASDLREHVQDAPHDGARSEPRAGTPGSASLRPISKAMFSIAPSAKRPGWNALQKTPAREIDGERSFDVARVPVLRGLPDQPSVGSAVGQHEPLPARRRGHAGAALASRRPLRARGVDAGDVGHVLHAGHVRLGVNVSSHCSGRGSLSTRDQAACRRRAQA